MEPVFFETQHDFRKWLENNHISEQELLVGYYKVNSGKKSITWAESVDQALCFGWIDGVRRTYNEEAYTIRFTPRKERSTWSAINIDKMEALLKEGKVLPAGKAAYEKRTESNSRIYSHERKEDAVLPADMETAFKGHVAAWEYFNAQPPSYKKMILHWITTAKQEITRQQRFEKLLAASIDNKRLT